MKIVELRQKTRKKFNINLDMVQFKFNLGSILIKINFKIRYKTQFNVHKPKNLMCVH